jgi:hypothetical protein
MDVIVDETTVATAGVDEEGGEPTLTIETPNAHVDMGSVTIHFTGTDEEVRRRVSDLILTLAGIFSDAGARIEARG